MNDVWQKIKLWTKIVIAALVLFYLITFALENGGRTVQFWFWFGHDDSHALLMLLLFAFLAGIVATFVMQMTFRTLRQVRGMRDRSRSQRLERDLADMKSKAAMLQTRPVGEMPSPREPAAAPTIPDPDPTRKI